MAVFDVDAVYTHPLDFRLAGRPKVFWNPDVLREATEWLSDHGYDVVALAAGDWVDQVRLHDDLSRSLNFPAHYGRNLDALNDCMFGVACGEYGYSAAATGLVLVLMGFDRFARSDRTTAQTVLNIIAGQATFAMQFGHRILVLVQSDDPDLQLDPMVGFVTEWNGREWLDTSRH